MGFIKALTEGGQTWAHRLRMMRQVLRITLFFSASLAMLSLLFNLSKIPSFYYKSTLYRFKAILLEPFGKKISIDAAFWQKVSNHAYRPNEKQVQISSKQVLRATQPTYSQFSKQIKAKIIQSTWVYLISFFFLSLFFAFRGRSSKKMVHLSGVQYLPSWKLRLKLLFTRKASDIRVASLPLLKESEMQHILITGTTGTGKSTSIRQLLSQIRSRGERGVVVDTTGTFVSSFFREGKDLLLNPFHEKSIDWQPWCECTESYHYEEIVNSLIPTINHFQDDFFSKAGRAVLCAALQECEELQDDIQTFLNFLLKKDNLDLYNTLSDTDASIYLDPAGERTTVSIRATITNIIRHLRPLKNTSNPFSIRDWLTSEKPQDDRWLFLACTPEQRQSLIPLISVWFSIALNATKSRTLDPKNSKIWFIIDELHSLQKLEYLEEALAELRKYHGCLVLATQDIAQLDKIYGVHATKTILDLCGTKICFRQSDTEIARRMSGLFGEREIIEMREGLSYGAHQMRDGVNLSNSQRTKPTIPVSEILTLKNLEAFIKLPGRYPATKIKFNHQ